jgi:hypothetical protein
MIFYKFKTDSEDGPLMNSVWHLWKITFHCNTKLSLKITQIHASCVKINGHQQGFCIRLEHNVSIWCQTEANSFDIQEDQTW